MTAKTKRTAKNKPARRPQRITITEFVPAAPSPAPPGFEEVMPGVFVMGPVPAAELAPVICEAYDPETARTPVGR